tara:strand:- start:2048 stop:2275 length:228 start_codon:yes stop_codon:yes gene_type:complete
MKIERRENAINGKIFTDDNGVEHYQDSEGNVHYGMPPLATSKSTKSGENGWTIYDSSQGHCSFCGRLQCGGSCFK